ncbi:siderophore-interacting protein [Streptomyces sp. 7R007]
MVQPTRERWMLQCTSQCGRQRSLVRTCSIRPFRSQDSAIDMQICLHEQHGPNAPGTAWTLAAQPGDRGRVARRGVQLPAHGGCRMAASRR